MAKLTLTDITTNYASTTQLNANNAAIEAAMENTLSRDGTSPNQMGADLDMNSNKIINVAAPTSPNDAARLVDISDSDATGSASAQLRSDLGTVDVVTEGSRLIAYKHGGSTGSFITGASTRKLDAKLDDFGVWVTDYGASTSNTGAQNLAAFQDAAAAAVALKGSYQFDGAYYTGVPTIKIPAGVFALDVSSDNVFDAASFGMGANNFVGIHIKGDGIGSTVLRLTGTNYLIYNDNDWEVSRVSDLMVTGELNTEGFYYMSSTGVAKHPQIDSVWMQGLLNGIVLEGGDPGGNADHLRLTNSIIDETPSGGYGIRINNTQSIAHVVVGSKIRNCSGIGIKLESGAPLDWFGGSMITVNSGRLWEVDATNEATSLGSGNSMLNFYGIKPEMSGTSDFGNIVSSGTVTVNNSVLTQDSRSDQTGNVVTMTKGNLLLNNCRIPKTWNISVTPANNASLSNFPPEVRAVNCQVNGHFADFVTLNAPAGGSSNYGDRAKFNAEGCCSWGGGTKTDTFVDANVTIATDRITLTAHDLVSSESCTLTTTGTLPTGLATGTTYFVKVIDANTIELYSNATLSTIVNITAASGGGTHTLTTGIFMEPVDVSMNWDAGFTGTTPKVKTAIYRRSVSQTGGLPDADGFYFRVPLGATVVAWGVHHKVSAAGFRANYNLVDGDGTALGTTTGPTTGEIDETDDYRERLELATPVYCDNNITRAFYLDCSGTTVATQDGYVFVEYI